MLKERTTFKYRLEFFPPGVSKLKEMLVFQQLLKFSKRAVPFGGCIIPLLKYFIMNEIYDQAATKS